MSDKLKKNNKEETQKEECACGAQTEAVNNAEDKSNADLINVDKLNEKQAKQMLKEVLESNEALVNELKQSAEEAKNYKDSWYRTVADFENFKKRNADTRKNAYDDGKIDTIKSILVIGDSLDRALALDMDEKTREGVELIKRQFSETLKSIGVEEFNPLGEVFDPSHSEAIATVPANEENLDVVTNVFKKGYTMNGKTIRFAQVVVAK